MSYRFEVAVDSIESALVAQECGADRVELCADLGSGGITPSPGLIQLALERLHIPIHVILRPRRGDFLYTEAEFDVIRRDIEMVKATGADGVVFGVLRVDGTVDTVRTQALIKSAGSLRVTFHRAFDMCRDPWDALDAMIELGVDTLLTSGQESTAEAGIPLIAGLVERAGDRIVIMPGGSINPGNIRRIAGETGARTFHFSAKATVDGPMRFRNPRLTLGDEIGEYSRSYASAERIRGIIGQLTS